MSPGLHLNSASMNLVKSSQILSISLFLKEFFHRHSNKLLSSLFSKNHLYPLMISTTFVQFQTSTSSPKFSKKLLPPTFNLTCLLTHCLLLFNLAYRIFYSTETTLLKIHNDLILVMDHGEVTSLILFDLSAAFDTLDHSILLIHLQNWFGLDGLSLDWFSSHLSLHSRYNSSWLGDLKKFPQISFVR